MPISKPYKRTVRQHSNGSYTESGRWMYILDNDYANEPLGFIRSYKIIEKDIKNLFDYIEPADGNENTYSFRIQELLFRICVELESNFKAIFSDNKYSKTDNLNINDYRKINYSHYLSEYEVRVVGWRGTKSTYKPFDSWSIGPSLPWYQAYNRTKHDRHANFHLANFTNLIQAMSGLTALMSSQFMDIDFKPMGFGSNIVRPKDDFKESHSEFFNVKYPKNVNAHDRYEFEWEKLKIEPDKFNIFDYDVI